MLNEFKNRFILVRNTHGIQWVCNVLAIKTLRKSRHVMGWNYAEKPCHLRQIST